MPGTKDRERWVVPVAAIAVALLVVILLTNLMRTSYDLFAAAVLAPLLFAISIPALFRQAARERDERFAWLLMFALVAKLAGAVARYYVSFGLYGGRSDASHYWVEGLVIGPALRHGSFVDVHILGLSGTNFIRFLSGIAVAGVGPSLLGGFLLFSWVGFWGLFLFYRAFTIAVPEGRRRTYAALVFFLPSLIFWPSGVGKEAWMMLGLGLAAFGVARVLTGRNLNGFIYTVLGLAACTAVRPHIAAMLAIALVVALLVGQSSRALGAMGPVVKVLALVPVIVLTGFLLLRSQAFLQTQGINTNNGLGGVVQQTTDRTQKGGSRFAPSVLTSPWRAPLAGATVLFRPLLFEARDIPSMVAAIEGTFLIGLCLLRYRWIATSLRMLRRRAYLLFSLVYLGVFVAAYSTIANFGILVRERVQVIPFFLVLICVPPAEERWKARKAELPLARSRRPARERT